MSALPPIADIPSTLANVRFVPEADISDSHRAQTDLIRERFIDPGDLNGRRHRRPRELKCKPAGLQGRITAGAAVGEASS
jgi:hypothetical protein